VGQCKKKKKVEKGAQTHGQRLTDTPGRFKPGPTEWSQKDWVGLSTLEIKEVETVNRDRHWQSGQRQERAKTERLKTATKTGALRDT
jgi:hypothetical protein